MCNFFAELKRHPICGVTVAYAVVVWLLAQLASDVAPVLAAEIPRRVFLLQGLTASEPPLLQAIETVEQRLKDRSSEQIEVYTEFLDLQRFSGPENENRLIGTLRAKFAQVKPEVIVPISREAVDFVVRHRAEFAGDVPILYCCTPESRTVTPPDFPGVVLQFDWPGTLALAERLQPNAKTLVLISGASNIDRLREQDAIDALGPFSQKYETRYLSGLPRDVLLKEVSRLPRESIVLMSSMFRDSTGQFRGSTFAEDVSKASAAPIYSISAPYFGSGIVGGHMDSLASQAANAADLVLDILSGKDPATLPYQTKLPLQYRVDARQLERWGFAEASLPPGTSVEFRPPTLWKVYRNTIIVVLLAFVVLLGIITLLLIEMRKRREAEEARKIAVSEAELRRSELTHMMRIAALGELSGGIAHELAQPLAAILTNAQAAQAKLGDKNGGNEAVAEILADIVQDNCRASDVIHRLRRLMKKGERESTLINLNDKIASTLRLLHSELVSRMIRVETDLKPGLPSISGDRAELQQVFINLIMNASEAMASTPPSSRTLSIATRTSKEGYVEVSISDRGSGMSADELKRSFEPFFTTKERGLGLGLPICSTILGSHHGRLSLSNANGGGVTAVVSLPLAHQLAVAS